MERRFITAEPTPEIILVAVKAMLRNDAPLKAILAVIEDLEALGKEEQQRAVDRQIEQDNLMRLFHQKASS